LEEVSNPIAHLEEFSLFDWLLWKGNIPLFEFIYTIEKAFFEEGDR
jgi:hypothetical protein